MITEAKVYYAVVQSQTREPVAASRALVLFTDVNLANQFIGEFQSNSPAPEPMELSPCTWRQVSNPSMMEMFDEVCLDPKYVSVGGLADIGPTYPLNGPEPQPRPHPTDRLAPSKN